MGDGFGPLGELGALGLDAGLLGGQHVGVHKVLVAELQQALLLLLERIEAAVGAFGLGSGGLELAGGVGVYLGTDAVLGGRGQPNVALVVALDDALHVIDGQVGMLAGHLA